MKRSITKFSDVKIKNRLKKWFDLSTDSERRAGLDWYSEAQSHAEHLSNEFKISRYRAASVISALSPNNKWERNKVDAYNLIKTFVNGGKPDDVKVCTYGANKRKAFKILQGKLITESSPKTHAFAMNVGELSSGHITVDKWHLRACMTQPSEGKRSCVESCTNKQYNRVERITADLAREHGLKGYEFQAIVWVTIKNNWR
jgi:hypothetical protein